jgi:hypothetical protein
MHRPRLTVPCLTTLLWFVYPLSGSAQDKKPEPAVQAQQAAAPASEPTAAELSRSETLASALMRAFDFQEYEFRSAAEAMPAEKYGYRPAPGDYGGIFPGYGPKELRTFAEQVRHVACANFAFSAELEGKTPPPACDKGEPAAVKSRAEILTYLRDSFAALKKSLNAINEKNKFDPIEGPYAGPNTRLGMAGVTIWHVSDHYGQIVIYLRMNGIVPPASRPEPPKLQDKY